MPMHSKALIPLKAAAVPGAKPVSLRQRHRLRCSAEVEPPKATPATPKASAAEGDASSSSPEVEPLKTVDSSQASNAKISVKADSVDTDAAVAATVDKPASEAKPSRKPSPLAKGGSLKGDQARGKDPAKKAAFSISTSDNFEDERWKNGTWDLNAFKNEAGQVDWDAVIDAEVVRRKWLEDRPESTDNEAPVTFMLSQVPWWAWVKRFHLPEAEKVNGRAAMIGYVMAYLVDLASGHGLVDQQSSFLGKTLLLLTILGCGLIRKSEDLDKIRGLVSEATFYDKQWQSTWNEGPELPEDALPGRTQEEDLANPPKMR